MSRPVSLWRRLFREYAHKHGPDAFVAVLAYVCKHSVVWATPLLVGLMIDLIDRPMSEAWPKLALYGGITMFLLIQHVPMNWLFVNRASKIGRHTGRRLRMKVCRQLQQLSLLYHERAGVGRLQSKLIREIGFVEGFPRQFANTMLNFLTVFLGTVVMIAIIAPEALVLFIVMFPLAAAVRAFFKTKLRRRAHDFRQSVETMSGELGDMIKMVPITRAHGLEQEAIAHARDRIDEARDRGHDYDNMTGWFGAAGFSSFSLFHRLFLIIAVYFAIRGRFTQGEVVALVGYFGAATNAVQQLLNVLPQYTQTIEGYESISEVLDAPDVEHNAGKKQVERIEGEVDVREVAYTYPGADQPAVDALSFKVECDQTVAIVGPSGGGKSTALSLLLGFVRPQRGRVFYDGVDGAELDLRSYRQQVSVVTQQSFMFSGTIRENVAYGHDAVSDEQITAALNEAQAWDFVLELPEGLDTRLGEDGIQLSGGQTQRLAIARALIRNPRLLVLDEPTSALDIEGEIAVIRAIDNVKRGRTTVIVSHSLAMIRGADQIFVVEGGRVVDAGAHEQLMQRDNFYSRSSRKLAG